MNLNKVVSEKGKITMKIDGEDLNHELSRKLTGTTGEGGYGIFEEGLDDHFEFGEFKTYISFVSNLDWQWCVEDLADRIGERIRKVNDWVLDCKATAGCVEIKSHD